MTINVSDGRLEVKEGNLYWRYVAVADDNEDGSRPILLFMHAGFVEIC
jgi:hypothetical protein